MSSCLFEYLSNLKVKFRNRAEEFRVANMVPFPKSVKNGSRSKKGIRAGILAVPLEGSGNLYAVSL